jgi:hypothetical protein
VGVEDAKTGEVLAAVGALVEVGVKFVATGRAAVPRRLGAVGPSCVAGPFRPRIRNVDSQVTGALIGVGGAVFGALVAAFVGNLRPNVRNVRGAARILAADFAPFEEGEDAPLPTSWADDRELLAAELGQADWDRVLAGYNAAATLHAAEARGAPLVDAELKIETEKVKAAREVLGALSGGWPFLTQVMRRT